MKRHPDFEPKKRALIGLGLDGSDGEKRMTKGEDFLLLGGSEETHERMTEKTIRFQERLARKGITISEIRSGDEFRELMDD